MRTADPLRFHGDREVAAGLLDAAVNVRLAAPPAWLAQRIAGCIDDLGRYPDAEPARTAVAARHRRAADEVLLTAGAAEAFVLLARVLRPQRAVCVHPSFTEPEAAMLAAGIEVERVLLAPPFRLEPDVVPDDADLVVLGNPTNPTSVLHPAAVVERLARPGRVLVVDEAFADFVPDEPESLAARRDLPGLVVIRSLTKMWGLAGLRVGYLLGAPDFVRRCAAAQPLWSVSSPALAAAEACSESAALAEADAAARHLACLRKGLTDQLMAVPGVQVVADAAAPFLLLHVPNGEAVRQRLRAHGVAVRRGDTFPGLSPDWLRVAVRDNEHNDAIVAALTRAIVEVGSVAPLSPHQEEVE